MKHVALLASVVLTASALAPPLAAQDRQLPTTRSKFADLRNLRLEYFEFGESGIPLVFVQDHHDYFRLEQAEEWSAFLGRFADSFRVLAPVRRGWGESDDPGYGYDVATQSEDILSLLDALGVGRAVFIGGTLATQELTWITEHHRERVIGLVYLGTPFTQTGDSVDDPEVERFGEMYGRLSCDISGGGDEVDQRLQPREAWRAHFMDDPDLFIDVPTLLYLHTFVDRVSFNLRRLDRLEAGEFGDEWCDEAAQAYFTSLAHDRARLTRLRRAFQEEGNRLLRVHAAMERAFGDQLTVVWDDSPYSEAIETWYRIIRPFVEDLAGP